MGKKQSIDGYRCIEDVDCPKNSIKLDTNETGLPLNETRCLECNSSTSRPLDKSCQSIKPFIFVENGGQQQVYNIEAGGFFFSQTLNIPNDINYNFPVPGNSSLFAEFSLAAYQMCRDPSRRNNTACQFLANMWTLSLYSSNALMNAGQDNKLGDLFSAENQTTPWLVYPIDLNQYKNEYSLNGLNSQFLTLKLSSKCSNSELELISVEHNLWGGFKRSGPFDIKRLQLCNQGLKQKDSFPFTMTNLISKCSVNIQQLFELSDSAETIFYDLYLKFGNGSQMLPLPVNINEVNKPSKSIYRRFFLFETTSSIQNKNSSSVYIRFAKSVKIIINRLQKSQIYPPIIEIEYDVAKRSEQKMVDLSFEIKYLMDNQDNEQLFLILLGSFAGFAFLWSIIRSWNWNKRSGRIILDLVVILKFFMFLIGFIPNCIILVLSGLSILWFIIFNSQTSATFFPPQPDQEKIFFTFLLIAFVLKLLDVLYMILLQTSYDIFFIDWERPRADEKFEKKLSSPEIDNNVVLRQQIEGQNSISCWRTIFIANKWNGFQTLRKTSNSVQVFLVIILLKVLSLENYARKECTIKTNDNQDNAPYSFVLRVGIGSIIYIGVELFQILFFGLFYSRCIRDEIGNFVDYCSVSNISMLVLTHSRFGYYVHGRSPNGNSDTSLFNLGQNLIKEESNLTTKRGLEIGSSHQVFSALFPTKLIVEYSKIISPVLMVNFSF